MPQLVGALCDLFFQTHALVHVQNGHVGFLGTSLRFHKCFTHLTARIPVGTAKHPENCPTRHPKCGTRRLLGHRSCDFLQCRPLSQAGSWCFLRTLRGIHSGISFHPIILIFVLRCVSGEDKVTILGWLMAGKSGFVYSPATRFAVGELSKTHPPLEALWVAESPWGQEMVEWREYAIKVRESCWPFFGSF